MYKKLFMLPLCLASAIIHPEEFVNALRNGDKDTVMRILDTDRSLVNTPIDDLTIPLHIAIDTNLDMVKTLVSYGADVNMLPPNKFVAPPLRWAFSYYHPLPNCKNQQELRHIIAFLLESGANPNIPNDVDHTPIYQAAGCADTYLAYLLLRYGAHAHTYGFGNSTPLLASKGEQRTMQLLIDYGGYDTHDKCDGHNLLCQSIAMKRGYNTILKLLQHGSHPHPRESLSLAKPSSPLNMASLQHKPSIVTLLLSYGANNIHEQDAAGHTPITLAHGYTFTVLGIILPALENGDISTVLYHTDHVTAGCMALGQGYRDAAQRIYDRASETQQVDILLHAHILLNLCHGNACGRALDHISPQIHDFVNNNTTDKNIPKLLHRTADELHRGRGIAYEEHRSAIIIPHVRKICHQYASYINQDISNKLIAQFSERILSQEATSEEMEYFTNNFIQSISKFRDRTRFCFISYVQRYMNTAMLNVNRDYIATGDTLLHSIARNRDPWVTEYAPMIAYHVIPRKNLYNYALQTPLQIAYHNNNVAVSRVLEQWRLLFDCNLLCQTRGTRSDAVQRLLHTMATHGLQNPSKIDVQHNEKAGTRAALPIGVRRHIIEFAQDITDHCIENDTNITC